MTEILSDFFSDLLKKQKSLPSETATIIQDNSWQLYVTEPVSSQPCMFDTVQPGTVTNISCSCKKCATWS